MDDRQEQEDRQVDFLLLGGGVTSATAAETLRHEGADGSIMIISDEQLLPYHRPPLSTRFQLAEHVPPAPLVLSEDFYTRREIDVLLGTRATAVDPKRHVVDTDHAGSIRYDKLLIATGARPVRLRTPGAELAGIHYLRTLPDARAIVDAAGKGGHAVVVGGGFISLELAAAFLQRGLRVTIIAKFDLLFDKLDDATLGRFFCELYAAHDAEIILYDTIAAFRGAGRVEAVVTHGGRSIPCDFVAVGIGVTPDIEFLEGSGIAVDDGILVDRHLQASQPDVYAAGDVANFFDPVFKMHHRIEHWDNAVKQGKLAARNMLGQRLPYDDVSYFSCQLFDFGFQFLGQPEQADARARIGSLQARSCALLYLHNDVPRALFSTGRPAKETRAIESLIRHRTNIGYVKPRLSEPDFSFTHVPGQTAIILQGGGALGAFECGVVQALEEAAVYPDIVAGVSIGAFNGAIIAANPRCAAKALEAFWDRLSLLALELPEEHSRRMLASWQALAFGVPGFFRPRWAALPFLEASPLAWTSFYDPTPVKRLLADFADFDFLASSPVRLLVSAVNVETARLEVFDSYVDAITPEHILASGSLPPGFPWTTINGKHYWDGGIISNSPLELVIERTGAARKRIFIVNLFPNKKPLPTNLTEVLGRRDEIVYTERIRRDSAEQAVVGDFRKLVHSILAVAATPDGAAQVRQWPNYIQLMGDEDTRLDITRITRQGAEGEPASKDYDFSRTSIFKHMQAGYQMAKLALRNRRQSRVQPAAPSWRH